MAESVYKGCRRKGFTTVYREVAQDARLSLKARGLFLLMQSLPEDWNYTISGLAQLANTGKDQIRSGLKELLEVGYLVKEQSHDGTGKFAGNIFILQENAPPLSGNPTTGNPTTEKPSTENPTQQNNNIHIPPIVPQGGTRKRKKKVAREEPDWKPERFHGLWAYYPDKGRKDKQAAMDAWDELQPDDALIAIIARSLEKLKASPEWQDGIGIPYLCRFLRKRRWEDAASASQPQEAPAPEVRVPRYVRTEIVDGEERDIYA